MPFFDVVAGVVWCGGGGGAAFDWAARLRGRRETSGVGCGAAPKQRKKRPSSSIASLREPSTTKLPPAKNHRKDQNEDNIRFRVRLFLTGFLIRLEEIKLFF